MMRRPPHRLRAAFTLIELLVVVSVIGLLIGILLPVLGSTRTAGRQAVCASNLRQLALGNTAYATDHNAHFAPAAARFIDNLRRWHGSRDNLSDVFDSTRSPLQAYLGIDGIRRCPEFDSVFQVTDGFEAGNGGYGYNREFVGTDRRGDLLSELGARTFGFARPSQTVMFSDAAFGLSFPGVRLIEYSFAEAPQFTTSPASPSLHFRHRQTVNTAWLDGHVDSRKLGFTRAGAFGLSEAQNRELGLGWFGQDNNDFFDHE